MSYHESNPKTHGRQGHGASQYATEEELIFVLFKSKQRFKIFYWDSVTKFSFFRVSVRPW